MFGATIPIKQTYVIVFSNLTWGDPYILFKMGLGIEGGRSPKIVICNIDPICHSTDLLVDRVGIL